LISQENAMKSCLLILPIALVLAFALISAVALEGDEVSVLTDTSGSLGIVLTPPAR
jgi:hypothetical protein